MAAEDEEEEKTALEKKEMGSRIHNSRTAEDKTEKEKNVIKKGKKERKNGMNMID